MAMEKAASLLLPRSIAMFKSSYGIVQLRRRVQVKVVREGVFSVRLQRRIFLQLVKHELRNQQCETADSENLDRVEDATQKRPDADDSDDQGSKRGVRLQQPYIVPLGCELERKRDCNSCCFMTGRC